MLKTLAIGVEQYMDKQTAMELAKQEAEAKQKTMWIIILCVILAVEIGCALLIPKIMKKYNERKAADELRKAERKRIQSKRKNKEY